MPGEAVFDWHDACIILSIMSNGTYYRVQSADESPEALLLGDRKDGWVASDEDDGTQPLGVSVCGTVGDLMSYIRAYSMAIQPGDRLLRISGSICDDDRDEYALRVSVSGYEDMGDAATLARMVRTRVDTDRVDSLLSRWS